MDQQQTGILPVTPPVMESVGALPVASEMPVQQSNTFKPIQEEAPSINWLFWLGLLGVIVVALSLVYFLYIKGRVGNTISISPQELSLQFSIDEVVIDKTGFLVLIMGNDFNAPSLAFYSSPLLPPGRYEDIVVNIDENNYKELLGTYKPTTKLFAYLFDDANKNSLFDNVNGVAQGQGPDKPIKDLAGNVVFVEILRPK